MIKKKVWIDLDNSPHVPFFKPIIKELKLRGISSIITIRNNAQTVALADFHGISYRRIGEHYGKNKAVKVLGTILRACQLLPFVASQKPALGISHGSRAMVFLSKMTGLPTLGIGDYEHTRGIFTSNWLLMPSVIPKSAVKSMPQEMIFTYPGIKEDVYVPSFAPDPDAFKELGIPDGNLIVIVRPPATEAHYHNPDSDALFEATIDYLSARGNVSMIILPRYEKQGRDIRDRYHQLLIFKTVIIPEKILDGLNLIWFSDFVVSGGGTMNREAAALGVPVYSIFRGTIGAVDKFLSQNNRLVLLEKAEDIPVKVKLEKRKRPEKPGQGENKTLNSIVNSIERIWNESIERKRV